VGNFAALGADGNLGDSGRSAADIDGKVPLVSDENAMRSIVSAGRNYFRSSKTGAAKILLPVSWTKSIFFIKIRGFVYGSQGSGTNPTPFELLIGRYANNAWQNTKAVLTAGYKVIARVRLGADNATGKLCIILNSITDSFTDLSVVIECVDITADGYNQIPRENWAISLITDESGITNIVETPVVWNGDGGVWYEPTLAPGAAGTLQYRKAGNIVFTKGRVAPNSTGALKIASLAAGFRPGETQMTLLIPSNGDKNNIRYLIINSSGDITLGESAGAALEYMIDTSFIAEN
jgi:hypothetical protein